MPDMGQSEHRLHVVLVEPEIPQNTGNIARTCAAVGASLHLVHPLGFSVDDSSVRRAGLDYWDLLTVFEYDSIAAFLSTHQTNLFLFSVKGSTAHSAVTYPADSYLVFGKETRGLPDDILHGGVGQLVRIPIRDQARCLNLSNAVAVGVFEVLRQWDYPGQITTRQADAANRAQPEGH